MTKYSKFQYKQVKERRWAVHPIWRGIGCLFAILIPVMSYAAANIFGRMNQEKGWIAIPSELSGYINLADIYRVIPQVRTIIPSLGRIYYMDILLTLGFMALSFAIFSVFYSFLYHLMGAQVKSPVDAPPVRKSPHEKVR